MATQNMIESAYSATPTASLIAQWDANKNLSANNHIDAFTTTATAAGTTILTVASTGIQFFTGATTQTVRMPVTSTLVQGQQYYIVNQSSGVVTVQSSGTNTIIAMAANTVARLTCILTSGTSAASWFAEYDQSQLTLPVAIVDGGTGVASVTVAPTATAWAGWDANKNFSADNFLDGYTTTATAAGTTTLTVDSTYQQFFTGATTQTVTLPVTSTLVLGQSFLIVNKSSGVVTVQSSGANSIQAMAAGTTMLVTCILTSGTTAASWNATNYQSSSGSYLPLSGGTLTGSIAFNPTTAGIVGTTTNDDAVAGNVGETVTASVTAASATSIANATPSNITSISLTAGEWMVVGNGGITFATGAGQFGGFWISTTSATLPDGSLRSGQSMSSGTMSVCAHAAPTVILKLAGTTTVYLSAQANFSVSTAIRYGVITAVRLR